MLNYRPRQNGFVAAFRFFDLLYHSIVRVVRRTSGNAIVGLATNILQSVVMVGVFYFMFAVLGLRGMAIRGDFILYLMTGIFLYLTHTKAMGSVVGSEGPSSAIMKHAPMTTFLSITSSALAALYLQLLSMAVILFVMDVAVKPIYIYNPVGLALPVFLAWFSGVSVGLIFLGLKPFFPGFVAIATSVYSRANMIASGKMFVANQLPGYIVPYFAWNPLFHTIDQARGAAFINYTPHVTSITYPIYFSVTLIVLGFMGEFFARQFASTSWYAKR